jgi:hypothetical protein
MNQNSLIEIGSRANVILRFKTETTINGKTYAASEPFLYLKDVSVVIDYDNVSKVGKSSPKNVIASSEISPVAIQIRGYSFSRKIASLISCFVENEFSYNPTKFFSAIAEEDTIYLTDDVFEGSEFYVYDKDFEKINVVYNDETNSLSGQEIEDGEEYLVSFSSVRIGTKFLFQKPNISYMTIEIQGVGNIDKKTKTVLAYFDKVSLDTVLDLNFLQDGSIGVPLDFIILNSTNNYIIFED